MKRPIKVFLFLAIIPFWLNSCRNEVIKIDPHFVGIWNGADGTSTYHLSIDSHSNGYWELDNHGNYQYVRGIARIRHGELSIGLKDFDINTPPVQDTAGVWTMTLESVVYLKQ